VQTGDRTSRSLSLTTGGITLLGVLVSVGVTVGMGLTADWWVRVLAGVGTTLLLALIVKLGARTGRGPLARLANWMLTLDAPEDDRGGERRTGTDGG
jgi:hypothetical protein